MHETHIIKNILKYFKKQEDASGGRIKKACFNISEFGAISPEHLRQHYRLEANKTKWENVKLDINRVPLGPELEITKLVFSRKRGG